jgi:hypothetical protein
MSQLLCPPLAAGWAIVTPQSKSNQLLEGRAGDTALLPIKDGFLASYPERFSLALNCFGLQPWGAFETIFQDDKSLTFSWTKEGMRLWLLDPPEGKELFL